MRVVALQRSLWVVVTTSGLLLTVSCVPSAPSSRDRHLLSLMGADELSAWRCRPVGTRRVQALWRRHEVCIAEKREGDRLSAISVDRDPGGHVSVVARTWGTSDSLVWRKLRDSMTTGLATELANGAPCSLRLSSADSAHAALAPNWTVDSLWRLPTYDLGVALSGPKAGAGAPSLLWSINLQVFVPPLIACGVPRGPAA
jgi:hypothetical protein